MQKALHDVSCYGNSTNQGNNPIACKPFTPYVKPQNTDQTCRLTKPLPGFEDLGQNHLISHLPGCMEITGAGADGSICNGPAYRQNSAAFYPVLRVLLRSKATGLYVTTFTTATPLAATVQENDVAYTEVFEFIPQSNGGYSWKTEINMNFVSATNFNLGPLFPDRNSVSTWETYTVKFINGDRPTAAGTEAVIMSWANNLTVSVQSNGQLWPSAKSIGDTEIFYFVDADAAALM